jgi:hypothetical protein
MQPLASLEHPAPASKVSFEVPRDLRREFAGTIAARNEADGQYDYDGNLSKMEDRT